MHEVYIIIALIFGGQAIGSLLGLLGKPSNRLLHSSLAFAGSMMLAISFFDLLPQAFRVTAAPVVAASFLAGIVVFKVLDKAIPHVHPEFLRKEQDGVKRSVDTLLMGMSLHNIPEGLAVGVGLALDPVMGLLIAVAVSIQDIPENLATIVPLYCVNKCKSRSFIIVMGTALFELVGFFVGYIILRGASLDAVGMSLAAAAGLMTYISMDELIPAAQIRERPKAGLISFALGVAVVIALVLAFPAAL